MISLALEGDAQKLFFRHHTIKDGLVGNRIFFSCPAPDGKVWFASDNGVCYYEDGEFRKFRSAGGQTIREVTGIYNGRDGKVWFYTLNGQLYFFNGQRILAQTMPEELRKKLENQLVNAMSIDRRGMVYISTVIDGKLYKWDGPHFKELEKDSAELNAHFIREVDRDIFIWGGGIQGSETNDLTATFRKGNRVSLRLANRPSQNKSSFKKLAGERYIYGVGQELIIFDKDGLLERRFMDGDVQCVYEDREDKLWIGLSGNGAICFPSGEISGSKGISYLGTQSITSISEGADGTMWFATPDAGLFSLPGSPTLNYSPPSITRNETPRAEEEKPELPSADVLREELRYTFPESRFIRDSIIPEIYVSGVAINEVDTEVANIYNLQYSENFIRIDYAGFVDGKPKNLQYKYLMGGVDDDWKFTNEASASYIALDPGQYTFSVMAMNDNGLWSRYPATVTFIIAPPYWNTNRFYTLIWSSGAVLLVFLVIFYFRYKARKHREENETNKRILSYELEALRAQMNPHFTFNTLSSIQNYIIKNNSDFASRYLSKFAKLMRVIMENSKQQEVAVKDELKALELYMELEALRLDNQFTYEVNVDERIDPQFDKIPSMLIQPYVENAIWHGLSHKKEGKGLLRVDLKLNSSHLICAIDDNGVGREKSMELNSGRKNHISRGMGITKERLEIINSLRGSQLSVNIIDKKDDAGQPTGTRVEIFVPYEP